jgi:hypothetical protein
MAFLFHTNNLSTLSTIFEALEIALCNRKKSLTTL